MAVPGGNLLKLALSVQGQQTVRWFACTGKVTNAVGKDVPAYAAPVDVLGSFQPMNRSRVISNGFDLAKTYATFYACEPMRSVDRGFAGDQFEYAGGRWQAVEDIDWSTQDSWDVVTLVRIGAAP